jgi:hypothetical protein
MLIKKRRRGHIVRGYRRVHCSQYGGFRIVPGLWQKNRTVAEGSRPNVPVLYWAAVPRSGCPGRVLRMGRGCLFKPFHWQR